MESTVKERLVSFINHIGITQAAFQRKCNLSAGYINNMVNSIGAAKLESILSEYPQLNRRWLLTGEGQMLNNSGAPSITQTNYNGNNNYIVGNANAQDVDYVEAEELPAECAPIVPTHLTKSPEVDVLKAVESAERGLEISPIVAYGMDIRMWYRVKDNAMAPYYEVGDMLALSPYEQGSEKVIPGKIYVVDTNSNGMVVRKLFPVSGGYNAKAVNREEFPEFEIEKNEIIRIFRVIMVARM